MPVYIINKNAQSTGEHEVHQDDCTCSHMPDHSNRIGLGFHSNCHSAVAEAKSRYPNHQIDGCFYCSRPCHTR